MEDKAYQELCQKLAKRGGRFPGMDIPDFYQLIKELFTPEEAAVFNEIPKDYHPADVIAANLDKSEQEILFQLSRLLGRMGDQRSPKNQADLCSKTIEKPLHVGR